MQQRDIKSLATLKAAVFVAILSIGIVVVLTQRLELLVLLGIPTALMLLGNHRSAVIACAWAMAIWTSRLPVVLFDFVQFSYVVYACVALTAAAYALKLITFGRRNAPFIGKTGWGAWLMVLMLIVAGVHGATHASEIPDWLMIDSTVDLAHPWPYFRTFVLPAILQIFLALMIGAAFSNGRFPSQILVTAGVMVWVIDLMIIGYVAISGESLHDLAQPDERNFLSDLGFHANAFGAHLSVTYALMLGLWQGTKDARMRTLIAASIFLTLVALVLSFSRGAYLACAVTTVVFFMRGSPARKVGFVVLLLIAWFVMPVAVLERVGYGMQSGDINAISANRLDLIWLPLLSDIEDHLFIGQGLNSVMWTSAQLHQLIAPVVLSHNGFLDLLLDFGILGAIPVLAAYAFLWRGFIRLASTDPDPRLRGLFYGAHLALIAFFLNTLTNNRITPTATSLLLWMAGGVLIGRINWVKRAVERSADAALQARTQGHQPAAYERPARRYEDRMGAS